MVNGNHDVSDPGEGPLRRPEARTRRRAPKYPLARAREEGVVLTKERYYA